MAPSFQKIDYALRPAKHTERRMLCDIFRRLTFFNRLSSYTYIGFGGIAFSDFVLFHRALGIRDMISIERAQHTTARIEDNKPFNTIKIINKTSSKVLPTLLWDNPHILWLDYDDPLTVDMFLDVATIANHAASGTALAFSFQCQKAPEVELAESNGDDPFERFVSTFSRDKVPLDADGIDLSGWKYGELGREMLLMEIESILASRNSTLAKTERVKFKEVCTIEYSDNAKMITVVGIFVSNKDEKIFEKCEFEHLDFIPTPRKIIKIKVPKLTLREIKNLEKQLPLIEGETLARNSIPAKDAEAFKKLYRYLPNFAALEN